jgi:hypothetical protein
LSPEALFNGLGLQFCAGDYLDGDIPEKGEKWRLHNGFAGAVALPRLAEPVKPLLRGAEARTG